MIPSAPRPSTDILGSGMGSKAQHDHDTPPVGFSHTPVQLSLLEGERQLLDQFAQEQFLLLRQAREQLLADKQTMEQSIEHRQQELESLACHLAARMQELREREHRLHEEEEAIPERQSSVVTTEGSTDEIGRRQIAPDAAEEMRELRKQLQDRQLKLHQVRAEREAAWEELRRFKDQQQQLERLRAERDAAVAQVRRPPPEPPDYAKFEREFAVLHRQLDEERRRLAQEAQELHLSRLELQKKTGGWQQEHAKEQSRLQQLAEELTARQQFIEQDRRQLEQNQRELQQRIREQRLREVELREIKEIAEQENARERAELIQERVRIARLREALRLEQEACRAEDERPTAARSASKGDSPC